MQGLDGQIAATETEAYNLDIACRQLQCGGSRQAVTAATKFMQDYLMRMADENADEVQKDGVRIKVATTTLEDWLWRGDSPVVKDMNWHVYAMWVYRVEKPSQRPGRRWVDMPFSEDYVLSKTHVQRLASEPRVPMFEGFIMPPSTRDSELSAMYKQLRTRPLRVEPGEDAVEVRLRAAFELLCERPGRSQR